MKMLTKTISAAVVILEYICLLNVVGINEAYEHEGSFLTWQVNNTDPAYLPVNLSSTAIKVSCLRSTIVDQSPEISMTRRNN